MRYFDGSRAGSIIKLGLLASMLAASQANAQVSTWFRANFENLNERGSNLYNFANRYAQSSTTWETAHTTNQGWSGSAAPHVTIHGCTPGSSGCNYSEHQFVAGWVTPDVGGSRQMGQPAYVRYRIKFDPNTQFPVEGFRAKFIMFGTTGTTPNSRWIIHLMPALDNQGCSLGFDYGYMGWTPSTSQWYRYSHWGFSANFDQSPTRGRYAGFANSVNISWGCSPAVLVTASNHASPVPKPQANGTAPVNGWYHMQFQAVPGAAGQATFRTWANNNEQGRPSSEHTNIAEGLGVTGWSGGAHVVGHWGTEFAGSIGFVIDDFEIGPTFDPNWYPGGTASPTPEAPTEMRAQ